MANTYELITSQEIGTATTNVIFSSIPQTFDDLVVKSVARSTEVASFSTYQVRFNGDSNITYSHVRIEGRGSNGVTGVENLDATIATLGLIPAANSTTGFYSNDELYIPNYTVGINKPMYMYSYGANFTASGCYLNSNALLWRNTSNITTITFSLSAGQFAGESTFSLYGIKRT